MLSDSEASVLNWKSAVSMVDVHSEGEVSGIIC